MPDEFLTVAQVADPLKLSQQTILNMIDRSELGAVRVGQRRVRIRQSQLDAFLVAYATPPRPERTDEEDDYWRPVGAALEMVVAAVDERDLAVLDTAITGLATAAQSLRASEGA
jgi:excisionase family DNA binding protein